MTSIPLNLPLNLIGTFIDMNYDLYFEQALNAVSKCDPDLQNELLELTLEQIHDDISTKYVDFTELENRFYNV